MAAAAGFEGGLGISEDVPVPGDSESNHALAEGERLEGLASNVFSGPG